MWGGSLVYYTAYFLMDVIRKVRIPFEQEKMHNIAYGVKVLWAATC